ncbi:MAG TPA: heterodisulfide reductase-related iron-sulfur binding cluster [Alphaproteobacteria bacterium]|nr:heterodisulfide reductase-related iron-sulfur binding cluster [Alphaproteobacteria bacterium]
MAEPNSGAPFRHVIDWQNPDFTDYAKLEKEMERVFDICHGCRRCFNLCDSFPVLFDMIDETPSGELEGVAPIRYKEVVDACTLCDMCFMTKCPYVPPHEFDLDFPHLMLRYRAFEFRRGEPSLADKELVATDRNGAIGSALNPLMNWAVDRGNKFTRPIMEGIANIDRNAALPTFDKPTFVKAAKKAPKPDAAAPAAGRKAALYATCFVNYNNTSIGIAAQAVLAKNGVETKVVHPECCGMPQLELGDIKDVARRAAAVAAYMRPIIEEGYRIVALVPSCALMLKFEWPLILPDNADVKFLSENTSDLSEYVVDIAKKEGMAPGMKPLEGGVTIQLACHARAQNMGPKGAEMLRLIPEPDVQVVERCSGHGGSWGVKTGNFETAMKVGKPVARTVAKNDKAFVASECPLAAMHILQGVEAIDGAKMPIKAHPIELLAQAYGLAELK